MKTVSQQADPGLSCRASGALRRARRPAWWLAAPLVLIAWLAALAGPALAHDPHDVIMQMAVSPDFAHDGTIVVVCLLDDTWVFGRSRDGGRSWQIYGLPMIPDDVSRLVFSPAFATDQTLFAATSKGGVWRSTDGGTTVERKNDGLTDMAVHSLAVSPDYANDHLVIAATPAGCFRSTDAGETWVLANEGRDEKSANAVAFAPAAGSGGATPTVFVAGKSLARSDDGGQTWKPMHKFKFSASSLVVSPNHAKDSALAICFGRFGGGVEVSKNGGIDWSPMATGLSDQFVNDLAFASDGTLFAASATVGCFRAPAAGAPWTALTAGMEPIASKQSTSHFLIVNASPEFAKDRKVFVASFEGLYHSENAGDAWKECDIFNSLLSERVAFSPAFAQDHKLVLGNYGGGPMYWLGGAQPWDARASSISSLYTNELVLSPTYATDKTLFDAYVGTWRSTDEGLHWKRLTSPITIARTIALSPAFGADHTLFEGGDAVGVARSTDGGDTWTELTNGLAPTLGVTQIRTSPGYTQDRTVFLSTSNDGIYRSTDGGDSWRKSGTGLDSPNQHTVRLSPDFTKDHTLFAGGQNTGVFVSHDTGTNWTASNAGLPTDVPLTVESIAISPAFTTDHTLFIVLLNDGVFRSTDGGASWTKSSTGLSLTGYRALEISPDFTHDHTLLLSSYDWAWFSTNGGDSWFKLPGYIRVDDSLYASTFEGRWDPLGGDGYQGYGYKVSRDAGAAEQLEFHGKSISWFSKLGPAEGTAQVFLDGKSAGLVNLANPQTKPQARVFTKAFPDVGWHTIRIVNAGAQANNPSTTIGTDGFEYTF